MVQRKQSDSIISMTRIAIVLTIIVITLGAWTRLNDAGLGCPDWPGCYGQFTVPQTSAEIARAESEYVGARVDVSKGWIEMIHRYAAGLLGFLILLVAVQVWRCKDKTDYPARLSFLLLLLVVLQGLFGMWTVTLKLLPIVVTVHLLGGLLTLTLLVIFYQRLIYMKNETARQGGGLLANAAMVGVALLFVQSALGGWTSANYAGWSCNHWFFCQLDIVTEFDFSTAFNLGMNIGPDYQGGLLEQPARAAIQMVHRFGAVIVVIALTGIGLLAFFRAGSELRRPAVCLCLMAWIQVGIGIANVVLVLPLPLAMAHHSGAVVLLLNLLWLRAIAMQMEFVRSEKLRSDNQMEAIHG